MTTENWLLLTDYSSKYRISVSTLRRRIKADQIRYRFESGKYYLLDLHPDDAVPTEDREKRVEAQELSLMLQPNVRSQGEPAPLRSPFAAVPGVPNKLELPNHQTDDFASENANIQGRDEPLISTATKLLNELKRAYMNILQEKEEQLIQLKEEVADLKTLVRVLEEDNDRLRTVLGMTRTQ